MKYPCLVFDHDDTVVNSTATIHYPAFLAFMRIYRPELRMTLDEYFAYNFEPGVIPLFRDICGLSEEEIKLEEQFWKNYVQDHIPSAYSGIKEIMWRHKEAGGLICVISHSFKDYILRDYEYNQLPRPDLTYGWDLPADKRKPDPYALYEIEKHFDLKPEQILVIDDLKPGYDMARAAGVPFAAAGWANDVKQIEDFMRRNCSTYFKKVSELAGYLFEE